jgi:hypothetical protein
MDDELQQEFNEAFSMMADITEHFITFGKIILDRIEAIETYIKDQQDDGK